MSADGVNGSGNIETVTHLEDLLADMSAEYLRALDLLLIDADPRLGCVGKKDKLYL